MFKFLFGKKSEDEPVTVVRETSRETIERALQEINGILAELDPKPAVTFDPVSGAISLALPEQMPDEAKALPAPEEAAATPDKAEDKGPLVLTSKAA